MPQQPSSLLTKFFAVAPWTKQVARPQVQKAVVRSRKRNRASLPPTLLLLLLLGSCTLSAATQRYRATWRQDPATSITIGFDHPRGSNVRIVYDTQDFGRKVSDYRRSANPARTVNHAGMRNVFVRLTGLQPGTLYYFLVVDSDGTSQRMIFETPPSTADLPLSIVAGGDSRNNRETALAANRLVAKLQPHFVLFGGDMTNGDSDLEWQQWLDDWQETISSTGRLTPIVPARGNHERSNASIYNLFDVPNPEVFYALDFAGGLLRTYTLNTLYPASGDQLEWLDRDLSRTKAMWKFAQYHHSMRPHTAMKPERDELVLHWGSRFYQYGMDLVIESDCHTVKQTWPIRPSREPGASQGFIRDDRRGTVYVGEGCWGAPLRPNDDNKPWTRASGRFNQFKWIWVDVNQVQIRTVDIDRSGYVVEENILETRFKSPPGFYYWEADNTGDVLRIPRRQVESPPAKGAPLATGSGAVIQPSGPPPVLARDASGAVRVSFGMPASGRPEILVIGPGNRLLWRGELSLRGPGPYSEKVSLPELPYGAKMELVVKAGGKVVAKYGLQ